MDENGKSRNQSENGFTKKMVIGTGIVSLVLALILLLAYGFKVLLLILAGVLIANLFMGVASFIRAKLPINRTVSLLITVVLVLGISFGIGFALAPRFSDQVDQLKSELPQAAEKAKKDLTGTEVGRWVVRRVENGIKSYDGGSGQVKNFFNSLFGGLGDIYIIIFLGIFFMISPNTYLQGIVMLFPIPKRDRATEVLEKIGTTLRKWLLGKILSMLIVGVLTGIGLAILGIPLAMTLAIFATFISFIPNFGPLIALVPAFLLAFTVDPIYALYVVMLYAGIQAVESNIITPLIQKKMISFPMALILIAQVFMGIFTGFLGLILAVPVVAILVVLIKMLYIKDVLGDESVEI